ncbi:MAG TPA: hypothetical protein VGB38_01630, partial [bacterium]
IFEEERFEGWINFTAMGKSVKCDVRLFHPDLPELSGFRGFVEDNGTIAMKAAHFTAKRDAGKVRWETVLCPGSFGESLEAMPLTAPGFADTSEIRRRAPHAEYAFYQFTEAAPEIITTALPTHPLDLRRHGLRAALSVDDGPLQVVDFTTYGRSETWKRNVLANRAEAVTRHQHLGKGFHRLKLYMIDPGVIVDRMVIDLGGLRKGYSPMAETRIGNW